MNWRMGLYGGAFDPPHIAHVALATAAIAQLDLDVLRVVPTGDAPHKQRTLTPSHHRLTMADLAFSGVPKCVVDSCEIARGGASYTIDTLRALQKAHPQAEWTLIVGEDQFTTFHSWRSYQDILKIARLAVARRSDADVTSQKIAHTVIDLAWQPISSSQIRQQVRLLDERFQHQLHPAVAHYIQQHNLYL